MNLWTWLQASKIGRLRSLPASNEHRLLWGWIRLVLGLSQMGFALATVYALAFDGLHWRAGVAALIAAIAAATSRFLYAGRPDPRIEAAVNSSGR